MEVDESEEEERYSVQRNCTIDQSFISPHLDARPFARDGHEVPLHGIREASFVQGRLDDGGRFRSHHHREALSHALHLFQDVVLSHEVDDAHDELHLLLVDADQDAVVEDVDDGQEEGIVLEWWAREKESSERCEAP